MSRTAARGTPTSPAARPPSLCQPATSPTRSCSTRPTHRALQASPRLPCALSPRCSLLPSLLSPPPLLSPPLLLSLAAASLAQLLFPQAALAPRKGAPPLPERHRLRDARLCERRRPACSVPGGRAAAMADKGAHFLSRDLETSRPRDLETSRPPPLRRSFPHPRLALPAGGAPPRGLGGRARVHPRHGATAGRGRCGAALQALPSPAASPLAPAASPPPCLRPASSLLPHSTLLPPTLSARPQADRCSSPPSRARQRSSSPQTARKGSRAGGRTGTATTPPRASSGCSTQSSEPSLWRRGSQTPLPWRQTLTLSLRAFRRSTLPPSRFSRAAPRTGRARGGSG